VLDAEVGNHGAVPSNFNGAWRIALGSSMRRLREASGLERNFLSSSAGGGSKTPKSLLLVTSTLAAGDAASPSAATDSGTTGDNRRGMVSRLTRDDR
jgi:hypothetical protein